MMLTLADIASLLSVTPSEDGERVIAGINTLADAMPDEVSFLTSDAYLKDFQKTRAAAVIVQNRVKLPDGHGVRIMLVPDADLAVAKLLERFAPPVQKPAWGIDASAHVAATSLIGPDAMIGPRVVIGERSRVGARVQLHAGVVVGDDVVIGDDCVLYPNVVIRERITLGNRVIIHSASVIGSDGFGYRWDGTKHAKIPQIGTVIIEDDVEIGSCACIDRAKFSSTRIGRGTKIDNLAQIGHNVQIGPHCVIVGQAGVAGSVLLGTGVVLGGQSAVRDHVRVGDQAMVAGCSGVMEDVAAKTVVSGLPAYPHRQSLREQAALRRLPELITQVRQLTEELENLKTKVSTKQANE